MIPASQQTYPQLLWTKTGRLILQIALDIPLRRVFDYLAAGRHRRQSRAGAARARHARESAFWAPPSGRHSRAVPRRDSTDRRCQARRALEILDMPAGLRPGHLRLAVLGRGLLSPSHRRSDGGGVAGRASRQRPARRESHRPLDVDRAGRRQLEDLRRCRAPRQRALLAFLAERGGATAADLVEPFKPGALQQAGGARLGRRRRARPRKPAPFELASERGHPHRSAGASRRMRSAPRWVDSRRICCTE